MPVRSGWRSDSPSSTTKREEEARLREEVRAKQEAHQAKLEARRERRAQGIVIPSEQAKPSNVEVDVKTVRLRGYHALRRVFPQAPHKELMGALQSADQLPVDARVVAASRQLMTKHCVASASSGQIDGQPTVRVIPSTGPVPQMKLLRRVTVGPLLGAASGSGDPAPRKLESQDQSALPVPQTIPEDNLPDDLPTVLLRLLTGQGLADKAGLATAWVEEQGACDLEEVLENFEDFSAVLVGPLSEKAEEDKDTKDALGATATSLVLSPLEQLRQDLSDEVAASKARAEAAKIAKIEANTLRLGQANANQDEQQQQQPQQQHQFQPPMRLVRLVKTVSTPVQPLGARLLSEGVPGDPNAKTPTKIVVVKKQQQQKQTVQPLQEDAEVQVDGADGGLTHSSYGLTKGATFQIERTYSLDVASLPPGTVKQVESARRDLAWKDRQFSKALIRQWTPPKERAREKHAILSAKIPTQAEINASEIARKRAIEANQAEMREKFGIDPAQEKEKDTLATMEGVREAFLEKHGTSLRHELGAHVTLRPAPTSQSVDQKFVRTVKLSGSVPSAGYHGTDKDNFTSIFEKGLLVPGRDNNGVRVVHGSAHGAGIYTAKPGAATLSRGFCDSEDMLVCGIVTSSVEKEETRGQPKQHKMVNGHRDHHKPDPITKAPTRIGRFKVGRNDRLMREVGDARIIFREEHIAPLFIAQGAGKIPKKIIDPQRIQIDTNPNKTGLEVRGGRQQELIKESGERVWTAPEEYRDGEAMRVKRMYKDKDLAKSRANDRAVKAALQNRDELVED